MIAVFTVLSEICVKDGYLDYANASQHGLVFSLWSLGYHVALERTHTSDYYLLSAEASRVSSLPRIICREPKLITINLS